MDTLVAFVGGELGGILVTYIPYLLFSFICKSCNLAKKLLLKNTFCLSLFFLWLWFSNEDWPMDWYVKIPVVLLFLYAGFYWLLNIRTKKPKVVHLSAFIDFFIASYFGTVTAVYILYITQIKIEGCAPAAIVGYFLFFLPVSAIGGGVSGAVVSNIMLCKAFDNE